MKSRSLLLAIIVIFTGAVLSVSSRGADAEGQIVCPPTTITQGSNAETAAELRTAIYRIDVATVQRLLTLPHFSQLRDSKGDSPLHMAVSPCQASMVQLVLAHPGVDLNARDAVGRTPLNSAAAACDRDVLDRILNHPGADPNVLYSNLQNSPTNFNQNRTSLHDAAWNGNVGGVTALLDYGARPNPRTSGGFTPLHLAAMTNRDEVTRALLSYGADPNAHDREEGRTPLHMAIPINDSREPLAMQVLVADPAADLEAEDDKGQTLLHLAAFRNSENAAVLLLNHHVDPNAEDDEGRTPLHLAAYYADIDMVELLLGFGADPSTEDDFYRTPLYMAEWSDNDDVVDLLRRIDRRR